MPGTPHGDGPNRGDGPDLWSGFEPVNIHVTASLIGGSVELRFDDDAPVPVDSPESLFELPGAAGLAAVASEFLLCRKIAGMHRGTVRAIKLDGGGLRIACRFPASSSEADPARAREIHP